MKRRLKLFIIALCTVLLFTACGQQSSYGFSAIRMFRHKVTIDLATENRYNKSIQAGGLPMNDNFTVRKANENDISLIENLIKVLPHTKKDRRI